MAPISKPLLYLLVNNTFDILLQIPVNEQKGERTFSRHTLVHAAASSAPPPSSVAVFFSALHRAS